MKQKRFTKCLLISKWYKDLNNLDLISDFFLVAVAVGFMVAIAIKLLS